MQELKTVKQLREFLSNFSDDCMVGINVSNIVHEIEGYGWVYGNGGDYDVKDMTVEQLMLGATELHLEVDCTHEHI